MSNLSLRSGGRALLCSLGLLLAAGRSPVSAQPGAAELRAEVDAVRAARAPGVPEGSIVGVEYLLDVADRISTQYAPQADAWRMKAQRYLQAMREGRDPYLEQGGRITNRGYHSAVSEVRQGYSVYLPPGYDPSRRYPLLVMLHGGSSNGNLFLGVVLGNNMDWLTYPAHLWDEYTPRWSPDWIVVAPDGFGQVLWRWMGEQDVLDVVDDVQRHYSVDADRVVLGGLSNGGLGSYAIGMRHAWRFSLVLAIAGAPSWLQYAGGSPTPEERRVMLPVSGMHLIQNSTNTDFRFFHGTRDPGPMRPAFVRELEATMTGLGLTPHVQWFDFGHDLLYLVHRHGRAYEGWAGVVRNRHPRDVRVLTGDYRANRQHWVTVERIDDFPRLANVHAVADDGSITVQTEQALEVSLDLRDAPIGSGDALRVTVDGTEVYQGPRAPLGHVLHVARAGGVASGAWRTGFLPAPSGFEKRPGLSGPLTDPYRDGMIHVYGTRDPAALEGLRAAAQRGARGWPVWLWNHQQRVVADSEVTPAMMRRSHLVLYGTPGANSVLEQIADDLPVRVTADAVEVGGRAFRGAGVGTRFVHPNPLAPNRYVVVQAAPTLQGVSGGHNLPDFLPDWVVYDGRTSRSRQRLISGRNGQVAMGFFDATWRVPTQVTAEAGPADTLERLAVLGGDEGSVLLAQAGAESQRAAPRSARRMVASLSGTHAASEELERAREEQRRVLGAPRGFVVPRIVLQQDPAPQLPPAEAPPVPSAPTAFAADASDPAGRIARQIAQRVPTFLNFRGIIPGGEWRVDPRAVWQVRGESDCRAALREAGVTAMAEPPMATPVPSPVHVSGPIGGVVFRMMRGRATPFVVSCELARRLPTLARVLRQHGIRGVNVLSAYRTTPAQSFHGLGLGLDLFSFETDDGSTLRVDRDFEETPAQRTCDALDASAPSSQRLLRVACDLAATWEFSSVLTPNYNDGHRNHFHIDVRPDDPRVFIR